MNLLQQAVNFVKENPEKHNQLDANMCIVGHALRIGEFPYKSHLYLPSNMANLLGITISDVYDIFGEDRNKEAIEAAEFVIIKHSEQEELTLL